MKIEISYYSPVKKEIKMTSQEFRQFHANGTFKKVLDRIPKSAIMVSQTREELTTMKVEISYYTLVEKKIEMTPQEFDQFQTDGTFHGEKVIPDGVIREGVYVEEATDQEWKDYFFKL